MDVSDLVSHGVPQGLIDIWVRSGFERLLPVQDLALRRYGLFRGESLIVSAPTSSGKTFVGEMAAGYHMAHGRRAIYLVPLKALASEKFRAFRARYAALGAEVVVSTRDHHEFDEQLAQGRFDLAILVYEKMQQLLIRSPGLLRGVGLVVADELQMLADRERGPGLEMLLTRIKLDEGAFQFIGLSAVLSNNEMLSKWLAARFLEYPLRPVELRQGILYNRIFTYTELNSRGRGREQLTECNEGSHSEIMVHAAVELAERGEQSILFLADRNSTRLMAQVAAAALAGEPAREAMEELAEGEETQSRTMLLSCLRRGVAFHNADLNREERDVVERHFRAGRIKIIVTTPTLALGVNLPARNVFIEPMLWDSDRRAGRPHKRHITKAECDNMGGRAGRLDYENEFGRAVLVAKSRLEFEALRQRYEEADLEELQPHLKGVDLATHATNLVAAGVADTEEGIAAFLSQTLTGLLHWRALHEHAAQFRQAIARGVEQAVAYGLVVRDGDALAASALGRVCAHKGLRAATAHAIRQWLESARSRDFTDVEAVYAFCRTLEARAQHANMSTEEYRSWRYPDALQRRIPRAAQDAFEPLAKGRVQQTYDEVKCMKVALLLSDWVEGRDLLGIEQHYMTLAGKIRSAAEVAAWLAEACAAIAELLEFPAAVVERMKQLAPRLAQGLSEEAAGLTGIRVPGFGRSHVHKLVAAGIHNVEALCAAGLEDVAEAIGPALAFEVKQAAAELAQEPEADAVCSSVSGSVS